MNVWNYIYSKKGQMDINLFWIKERALKSAGMKR